jgi:hypothetical protein
MKQTAVEWLFKQIYGDTGHIGSYTTEGKDAFEAFEKAKEMEREQIIEAYGQGMMDEIDHRLDDIDIPSPEYYYNETYGGEQ